MGKSRLKVTHPDITHNLLDKHPSRQCLRIGLRIAILRGVINKVPIDQLSRRHKMSRQGIYNLVKRVNEKGIKGLDTAGSGRPRKQADAIAINL
ncbi:MAG TPA: helix-turn-helix domain-containing protein [Syntrophales bacterium]|nr:helix-turn-helix domain-containing protein [Syntrophales bacterium]